MESAVRTGIDSDQVLTIWLDVPGKPVNTCTPQLLDELSAIIDTLETSKPAGVIFASAKARSFNAGADLFAIRDMDDAQVANYLAMGQGIYDRIAKLSIPTVAAINGDCLGGGTELALACTYRVAASDGAISIGLPEIKLGLIPAWGGTTRLPRLIGLTQALPILLAGKTLPPRKALRVGMIDEVVRPEALMAAAKRLVLSHRDRRQPKLAHRALAHLAPARNRILAAAKRQTVDRTYNNYPAPLRLLDVVKVGYERGVAEGLKAEREALFELTRTEACRNLLRLFFLRQGAKRRTSDQLAAKPRDVHYAAVIGGGTMGAGIVHALIRANIKVRLIEVDPAAASAGLGRIRKMLDEDISAGRLDKLAAHHTMNRVSPSTDWTGLHLADLVVEAVVENLDAKHDVFARLDGLVRPDAVLATNTSSLRVADIAQATAHPSRVLGLHFFNPVNKMPLVEIVRASQTEDGALATALALVNRLGKTPVLVNDATGFLVNRLLIPHLAEALVMASEGIDITQIDQAMKQWGMPMGPFELLDEIGLDVALHVLKSLSHVQVHPVALPPAIEQAVAQRWLGKKSGKGFYVHSGKRRRSSKPMVNEELVRLLATNPVRTAPSEEELQMRLVLPMVNEAARTLAEGVITSADDIDLATVLGLGFAPFRGGLAKFAEDAGLAEIVTRLDRLATEHGPRFAPTDLLRQLADAHRPFPRPAQQERKSDLQNQSVLQEVRLQAKL
jgi:3-hydroxyacyl-CoA dehydrogenase/enoyl-CoA hydratase/3-hydroxybutyryl-CoA epimerase